MSGSKVAYQLRINKYVDRHLFLEFLLKCSKYMNFRKYHYYGFGGYSFEDFKLLHLKLNINKMTSMESDNKTFNRQKFNMPFNCIKLLNIKSSEFISDIDSYISSPVIVWLDYADANQQQKQIEEFASLARLLTHGDIMRITMNAEPSTCYGIIQDDSGIITTVYDEVCSKRLDQYKKNMLEDYRPTNLSLEIMRNGRNFSRVLYYAFYAALEKFSVPCSENKFVPFSAFTYRDSNHNMLTITGVVLKKDKVDMFKRKTELDNRWDLFIGPDYSNWQKVNIHNINVPEFTLKEKLLIDSLLPKTKHNDAEIILKKIKRKSGLTPDKNEIENYIKYYRHYPGFRPIAL